LIGGCVGLRAGLDVVVNKINASPVGN